MHQYFRRLVGQGQQKSRYCGYAMSKALDGTIFISAALVSVHRTRCKIRSPGGISVGYKT